nr:hypothetical protein [Tanacetum cinerariifolium]
MDSNPSQPLVSTLVNIRMHKEDQEATGGPTSLKVTSKERSNPQLSSGKGASSIARQVKEEESSRTIKLEDLQSCDKDEEDEVHTTINAKTKENLAPKSSSPGIDYCHHKTLPVSQAENLPSIVKSVKIDNPDIPMEEYISLEEENARRHDKVYNWETAMYENDIDKVNMPLFLSPKPEVSYSNDLDFFKVFEIKFPAIVYNDALTSKSDFLTEHIVRHQRIDELNNETSLTKCDEKEQNILYFNDLFPLNAIYHDDLKSDTDNDNDKIDIEQPSGDISVIALPNVAQLPEINMLKGSPQMLSEIHSSSGGDMYPCQAYDTK